MVRMRYNQRLNATDFTHVLPSTLASLRYHLASARSHSTIFVWAAKLTHSRSNYNLILILHCSSGNWWTYSSVIGCERCHQCVPLPCLRCSRLRIVIRVLLDLHFESNDDDAFYFASRRVLLTCTESAELAAVALSYPSCSREFERLR